MLLWRPGRRTVLYPLNWYGVVTFGCQFILQVTTCFTTCCASSYTWRHKNCQRSCLQLSHGASRRAQIATSHGISKLQSFSKLLPLDTPSASSCPPFKDLAPSAVTDFPLELQLSILEYLSTSDLLHAAHVNKDLKTAVENALYANITLEWNHERQPAFSGLLRTLFARPKLAHHIKRLYLKGSTLDPGGALTWRPELPLLFVAGFPSKQARSFIESIGLAKESQETWKKKLQRGNAHALATLLICLAPNLSSLHLDPLFTVETGVLGDVLRKLLLGRPGSDKEILPRAFLELRELCMPDRYDMIRRTTLNNATDLLPRFDLPALESMVLSLDNPVEFAWPTASPPKLAKLSSLELRRVREQRLAPILAAASGLKSLTWSSRYIKKLDVGVSTTTIDLDAIVSALAPLRDSVENLSLDAQCVLGGDQVELPMLHLAGSMAGLDRFHCVRRLRIPWVFLMGFSPYHSHNTHLLADLPRSLEELILSDALRSHDQ